MYIIIKHKYTIVFKNYFLITIKKKYILSKYLYTLSEILRKM